MRKKITFISGISKLLILIPLIFLIFVQMLSGQNGTWFSIVDVKHNRCMNTYHPNELYHWQRLYDEDNEDYKTFWKFVPIKKDDKNRQLYQIIENVHGWIINVGTSEDGVTYKSNPPQAPTFHNALWRLDTVRLEDGLGVCYRIFNHHFPNRILGGFIDHNTQGILNYDFANDPNAGGEQCLWRLIEREGVIGTGGEKPENYVEQSAVLYKTELGSHITVYGVPSSCSNILPAYYHNQTYALINLPPDSLLAITGLENRNLISKLKAYTPYPISIYVENQGKDITIPDSLPIILSDAKNPLWHGNGQIKIPMGTRNGGSPTKYRGFADYMVTNGTTDLVNKLFFFEYEPNQVGAITWTVWPARVSGPVSDSVDVLGDFVNPKEPFMVLHDPPGDASFSEWLKSKTICREMENTLSNSSSKAIDAGVKLGFSGAVGKFVTVNIEAYVKFTVGSTKGSIEGTTYSDKTCITTNQGFKTSEFGEAGEDLFIGYGQNMIYGVGLVVDFDSTDCRKDTVRKRLYIAPKGDPETFAWGESRIRKDIDDLNLVWADSIDPAKIRTSKEALFQINTWEAYLKKNDENKKNATNNKSYSLEGNKAFEAGSEIIINNTSSVSSERFIEKQKGIEWLVEVAGSGTSGGYKFTNERRFGRTDIKDTSSADMINYTFFDDDIGDEFNLMIGKDPQFGTPVFNVDNKRSKTSCPFEVGYKRDQPKLLHLNHTSDHLVIEKVPVGRDTSFVINVCNESNEAREYYLKLDANSNLDGAVVEAAGVALNGNDFGQKYLVPANACLKDFNGKLGITVTVRQKTQSILAYPRLRLYLYSKCEEDAGGDISSSAFVSVFFGGLVGINDDKKNASIINLYPNPSSDKINLEYNLKERSSVKFEITNVFGNESYLSFEEELSSGNHLKKLDVQSLPSGIYILILKTNDALLTRKLVIER